MKRRLLLLTALAFAGCKKEQPAAPAPPAPSAAATPAPPAVPVRKDPFVEVPASDSTLSVLEPEQGKCQWWRQNSVAQKRAWVASLEGDCKGARLAWSQDASHVLFWFDPNWIQTAGYSSQDSTPSAFPEEKPTEGAKPRLYEVAVATGEVRSLPFPTVEGDLSALGYTPEGITARALQRLTEEQQGKDSITVDGKAIALDKEAEGLPALAHVYRLGKDGQWKRVATKATATDSDISPGVSVLDDLGKLGPTSEEQLSSSPTGEQTELTPKQLKQLVPLLPAPLQGKAQEDGTLDEGEWFHGVVPGGSFYGWTISGDFQHTTGHLVFEVGGKLQAVKDVGFTDGDIVALRTHGPFLLVSAQDVGTHPRLYDLRTGKRVFASDTARATTFWP